MVGDGRRGQPHAQGFALSVRRPRPHVVVVRAVGPLDLATISTVRETVVRHLAGAPVVLDLGPVTFLSGSAAQLLLDLHDHATACDTVLRTAVPVDEHARQVLDLTGVAASTPLHATVEEALHHLDPGPLDAAPGDQADHAGDPTRPTQDELGRAAAILADEVARTAGEVARIAGEVARIAGEVAATEEAIAAQRERLAQQRPHRAAELQEHARQAREFAEHERREQPRWQHFHDTGSTQDHPEDPT